MLALNFSFYKVKHTGTVSIQVVLRGEICTVYSRGGEGPMGDGSMGHGRAPVLVNQKCSVRGSEEAR